jgi:hypothetical protein
LDDSDAEATPSRRATTFRILVRAHGTDEWTMLAREVAGRTQDEAKRRAATMLDADATYSALIRGDGLELALTASRSWKPQTVKVEPQPSKITLT